MGKILELKGVKIKRGNRFMLDIPLFSVEEGEVISLIGPNGAGKTTLLNTLSLLTKRFEGEMYFRSEKVDKPIQYRRRIAMVFQEPLLFNTTVYENVASGLKFRHVERATIKDIVIKHLALFGIEHLADRSAKALSGGEAQRVSLARAFSVNPEILFLDEPFAALDPPTRESTIETLECVLRTKGVTTIFATHDRLEALRLSDRIAVMKDGKILQIGPPMEEMNYPINEFVASFVGIETILTGPVVACGNGTYVVSVLGKNIEAIGDAAIGDEVVLIVRPESVVVSIDGERKITSERNLFTGTIKKIISSGPYYKIHIDCGFPLAAYVTNDSFKVLSLSLEKRVCASFKATAVRMIGKRPIHR